MTGFGKGPDGRPVYYNPIPGHDAPLSDNEERLWDAAASAALSLSAPEVRVLHASDASVVAMRAAWLADAIISERRMRFTRPK